MLTWNEHQVTVAGLEAGVAGLCPASSEDRPRWYLVTCRGVLKLVDFDDGATLFEVQLPFELPLLRSAEICASSDGRFVAVVPSRGTQGALYDRLEQRLVTLSRTDYHADVSGWAVGFVRRGERELFVCASAWNHLEAFELPSMKTLAPPPTDPELDYFFGTLAISPSGQRLASFGWYWQPVGGVKVIDVGRWLDGAEGPAPGPRESILADWWDDSIGWLDEHRIALIGEQLADDPEEMPMFNRREGLVFLEVDSGRIERFIPGVEAAAFGCDGPRLYVLGSLTQVFDTGSGALLTSLERPTHSWHPGARVVLSCPAFEGENGPCVVRWLSGTLVDRTPQLPPAGALTREVLNVVADSLEEGGAEAQLVTHCRDAGPHGLRCWVLEGLR